MNRNKLILLVATSLVFSAFVALVLEKERLLATGDTIYLKLAPVDPRSLMQGDYMILDYELAQEAGDALGENSSRRVVPVVAKVDQSLVANFVRLAQEDDQLAPDEILLFLKRNGDFDLNIGAESFFFQEGHGEVFEEARYGELRFDGKGGTLLVGLRDESLKTLGPERW